jgi:hypothetical protein
MGSVSPQGFGTTLTVTYSATDPTFHTLAMAMRVLVAPGDLRMMVSHSPLPGFSEDTTKVVHQCKLPVPSSMLEA